MNGRSSTSLHAGFTLVELLVVIAIIGILMALTLPAVQSARESVRKTQCRNNVKNLAQASNNHLEAQKYYPSGGWGWGWAGDPDRGFGMKQCGGWMYSILPYIEETALHARGRGESVAAKRTAGQQRAATPILAYICPTRRRPDTFPYTHTEPYINIDRPATIARSDYAANGGDDGFVINGSKGPAAAPSLSPSNTFVDSFTVNRDSSGIVSVISQWNPGHVKDGLSKTYLIGERFVNAATYEIGSDQDDDQGWDVGYDWDTVRWTNVAPSFDGETAIVGRNNNFGSIHLGACHISMCDGSVKSVSYDIDKDVHRQAGNRKDGGPTAMTGIE
jgi:prepilin-type N-terminal cleavage/methylation domain-containing protein